MVFRDVMLFSTFQRIQSLHLKGKWSKKCCDAYVYRLQMAWKWGEAVSACALLCTAVCRQLVPCASAPSTPKMKAQFRF